MIKFTRIKDGVSDGDYGAKVGDIDFSIVRCIRPICFTLTARRNGKDLTGDGWLRWGTLRWCKESAEKILEEAK